MAAKEHGEHHARILPDDVRTPHLIIRAVGTELANRAVLAFETGRVDAAIEDLTHAITLGENAAVRYNRGIAYQSQERWFEASEDYTTALSLDQEDAQDLLYRRGLCYFHLGDEHQAQQDFQAHLTFGPSPYEQELRQIALPLFT